MTIAMFNILNKRITKSIINAPLGEYKIFDKRLEVNRCSHPLPDEEGLRGTIQITNLLKSTNERDLVFFLLSGGASALMPLPYNTLTLNDKKFITSQLLLSGASIYEINVVRKHLSAVKGGRLVEYINDGCILCSLIISDVVGDNLEIIGSGPTVYDDSTYDDAIKILRKYNLWEHSSMEMYNIKEFLIKGKSGLFPETPKAGSKKFKCVNNILVGNNDLIKKNIASFFSNNGTIAHIVKEPYSGDVNSFAKKIVKTFYDTRKKTPFAIIYGGETIVKVTEKDFGKGGRNQETILIVALELAKENPAYKDFTIACMGTDGIDGNSNAAGGIITPNTVSFIKDNMRNALRDLNLHDSNKILKMAKSALLTGYTGTNVNDVSIICVVE